LVLRDSSPLAFSVLSLEIVERNWIIKQGREAITQGLLPLDVAQGFGYAMLLHCDTDFGELRDYPPFKAIVVARK
jgi:hypothetical protein